MENKTKFVLQEFLRFICYALITLVLLLVMFGITHVDMVNSQSIPELSLTEILQEIILFACTGIFSYIAYKKAGALAGCGLFMLYAYKRTGHCV